MLDKNKPKIIIKECPKHGLTEYSLRDNGKKYKCKRCESEQVQRRRYLIKEKCIDYKGGKCEKCGYNRCNEALEFHHLNPDEKDFSVGKDGYNHSWEQIKKELDKCIMLCANCHRELHAEEHKSIRENVFVKIKPKIYGDDIIKKITEMKDNDNISFYNIAKILNIHRNTVMRLYHKYKRENSFIGG